jgi:hypothetical protein
MFVLADITLSAVGKLGEHMCNSLQYVYDHADELAKDFIAEQTPEVKIYLEQMKVNTDMVN